MTREEAIYCMKSYIDDPNYEHCTSCPYYGANQIGENVFVCNSGEAHKMAVEALEQEPCEYVVSLDAVIDVFDTWWAHNHESDNAIEILEDKLNALPPVTPQPKIGRWVLTQRDKCIDVNCSECGNTRFKDYAYGYAIELNLDRINDLIKKFKMNYCECCGAKMQEVNG